MDLRVGLKRAVKDCLLYQPHATFAQVAPNIEHRRNESSEGGEEVSQVKEHTMETYPPNFCGPNGYTHVPPGDSSSPDPSDSAECHSAQQDFALSTGVCALSAAGAAGTGGLLAAGAALACTQAVKDGWDMVDACGY